MEGNNTADIGMKYTINMPCPPGTRVMDLTAMIQGEMKTVVKMMSDTLERLFYINAKPGSPLNRQLSAKNKAYRRMGKIMLDYAYQFANAEDKLVQTMMREIRNTYGDQGDLLGKFNSFFNVDAIQESASMPRAIPTGGENLELETHRNHNKVDLLAGVMKQPQAVDPAQAALPNKAVTPDPTKAAETDDLLSKV